MGLTSMPCHPEPFPESGAKETINNTVVFFFLKV